MARLTTNLFLAGQGFAHPSDTHGLLDLTKGGQNGYAPDLANYVSNQAYLRNQLIAVLLEAPEFFQVMPQPEIWVQTLKSLIELHPRTIEGFNAAVTVEVDQHPVGGAGQQQHEFTNVLMAQPEPVFGYVDKYNRPIQNFFEQWIFNGLMHPTDKIPGASYREPLNTDNMLASWYSATILFFEPDISNRKVVKAWLGTNMWPKEAGANEAKRDLTAAREISSLSIPFTGLFEYSLGVRILAQRILDQMRANAHTPYNRSAFRSAIHSDVANVESGIKDNVDQIYNERIA